VAQSVTFLPKRQGQSPDIGGAEDDYHADHSYESGEYA